MKSGENILIVCTYENLAKMYRKVLQEYKMDIDIYVMDNRYGMDMPAVLEHIGEFRNKGKEIIISRGFLAQQIRDNLDYSVIEINITAGDMLKTMYPIAKEGKYKHIAVVEGEAYLKAAREVGDILGLNMKMYRVDNIDDFEDGMHKAKEDGADVIIGGAWRSYDESYFEDFDVPYFAVESTEESIKNSLQNAMEMYELTYEERRQKELMEVIVSFSDRGGILAVDEKGKLLFINGEFEKIFGHRDIDEISKIQDSLKDKEAGAFVEEINGEHVLMNKIPIIVKGKFAGTVFTVKRADQVRADDSLIRTELAKKGLCAKYSVSDIYGHSDAINGLKGKIEKYAATDATVLILGESGTGKELFAQAIHNASTRHNKPFVAINCSALPESLMESELFGYIDGAFTGARRGGKAGVFELAHTGTLFLDEIGDMDVAMQNRLLRAIQEKEIMRIGDNKMISVDVRIIAATNKNLEKLIREGKFREDLYYRLNLLDVRIPPLRERKEDIPDIVKSMLPGVNMRLNCLIKGVSDSVMEMLMSYQWRGNVRELGNVLERMALAQGYGIIEMKNVKDIFEDIQRRTEDGGDGHRINSMKLKDIERVAIEEAMSASGNNQTKAAAMLGIDRTTLRRKLDKIRKNM